MYVLRIRDNRLHFWSDPDLGICFFFTYFNIAKVLGMYAVAVELTSV